MKRVNGWLPSYTKDVENSSYGGSQKKKEIREEDVHNCRNRQTCSTKKRKDLTTSFNRFFQLQFPRRNALGRKKRKKRKESELSQKTTRT